MQDRFAGQAAWFDDHYAAVCGRVRLDLVLEHLRDRLPRPPARVIDIGGGTGAFAVPLAAAGYEVTLVDASEEWLERAAVNADAAGVRPLLSGRGAASGLDLAPYLTIGAGDPHAEPPR